MFDRTLGTRETESIDFKLKKDENPMYSIPQHVPKVHNEKKLKLLKRLVLLSILERANHSEWGAPSFTQPKPKKTGIFLSNFINLNT